MQPEIRGTQVLILGWGKEGQSVYRWLRSHHPGVDISVADANAHADESHDVVSWHTGRGYLDSIDGYDTLVRSPGVSPYLPQLAAFTAGGGHLTSATNIFFSLAKGQTIGITGTKGKSTTSSLIAHILDSARGPLAEADVRLVGNIGTPMLDHLEGDSKDTIFVIELSSHQLEDIRYSPHIAVILNIVPEHMDYYPDVETYKRAKANIVKFQTAHDIVVYQPNVASIAELSRGKKVAIKDMPIPQSSLLGNKDNIHAAISVAHVLDISDHNIQQAMETFTPLPHRLELIGEYVGITFYNDSLATIPQATIHALDALGQRVATLITGGFDRGLDYATLGTHLNTSHIKTLILFPDTGAKIIQNLEVPLSVFHVRTMEEAVKLAYKHTQKGKICLLSPASASFNLFRDYADRGEQFKKWVRQIGSGAEVDTKFS